MVLAYREELGSVVGNLLSLEFALRCAVTRLGSKVRPARSPNLNEVQVGDVVDETPLTGYEGLREVAKRYNAMVNVPDQVDVERVVRLRDAIAHGRATSANAEGPLRLVKFGKRRPDGKIPVEFAEIMDERWLKDKIDFTYEQLLKVTAHCA